MLSKRLPLILISGLIFHMGHPGIAELCEAFLSLIAFRFTAVTNVKAARVKTCCVSVMS